MKPTGLPGLRVDSEETGCHMRVLGNAVVHPSVFLPLLCCLHVQRCCGQLTVLATSSYLSIDPRPCVDGPLLGIPRRFLSGSAHPSPPLDHSGAPFPGAGREHVAMRAEWYSLALHSGGSLCGHTGDLLQVWPSGVRLITSLQTSAWKVIFLKGCGIWGGR